MGFLSFIRLVGTVYFKKDLTSFKYDCIGSNCPGISGTVPVFKHLSRVPEGSATCLLLVPDEGQTLLLDDRISSNKGRPRIISAHAHSVDDEIDASLDW